MKTLLQITAATALFVTPAAARLTTTPAQCVPVYGEPIKIDAEDGNWFYQFRAFNVMVHFTGGLTADRVTVGRRDGRPLSAEEVRWWLGFNGEGWKLSKEKNASLYFNNPLGRVATYDAKERLLTVWAVQP